MNIPVELRQIWRVMLVVMANFGFTAGLYLYTWAAYFHDLFMERQASEETAMLLMATLLMIRLGLVALLEIPLGAVGDALGRRKTVLWSLVCRALFFAALAGMLAFDSLSASYSCAIIASVAFALNYTLFSGTFTAWLVDSTRECSPAYGYERLIGQSYYYRHVAIVIGCLVGMYLYLQGLIFAAYIAAAILCVATYFYCAREMRESSQLQFVDVRNVSMKEIGLRVKHVISLSLRICRESRPILAVIIFYATFLLLVTIVMYYWPVALKSHMNLSSQSVQWAFIAAGVTTAAALGAMLFSKYADHYSRRHGSSMPQAQLRMWLAIGALGLALPIAAVSILAQYGQFIVWVFIGAVFASEGAYGIFTPAYEAILNKYIPSAYAQERSTILSLGSMARSVFVLLLAIPSSGTSGANTISAWILPAVLLLVVLVAVVGVLKRSDARRAGLVKCEA